MAIEPPKVPAALTPDTAVAARGAGQLFRLETKRTPLVFLVFLLTTRWRAISVADGIARSVRDERAVPFRDHPTRADFETGHFSSITAA